MVEVRCGRVFPILRSSGESVCSVPLPLHGQSLLAPRSRTAKPEWARPVGANATTHPSLASSGPYLPSLSFAPSARHHLRQEPDAGNPLVRICAGGTEKPVSLPRHSSPDAERRTLRDAGAGGVAGRSEESSTGLLIGLMPKTAPVDECVPFAHLWIIVDSTLKKQIVVVPLL